MALDDKSIQDLTKSIKDLIRVFNSSGGLNSNNAPVSKDGDGGDSYLTNRQKKLNEIKLH